MQLAQRNIIQTFIPVQKMEKGLLLEHILPNLKVPQSYEVRLTPITSFGAGDMAARIIRYMERRCLLLCPGYESELLAMCQANGFWACVDSVSCKPWVYLSAA